MRKATNKRKVSPKRPVSKRSNRSTKRVVLLCVVVFIISIITYNYFGNSRYQIDRQTELEFAYLYCTNKIIEFDRKDRPEEMPYYYNEAQRIERKIKNPMAIKDAKKIMEKSYWANQ